MNMNLKREFPLQQRNLTNLWKNVTGYQTRCQSQKGKKGLMVLKKVAKMPKLAEKSFWIWFSLLILGCLRRLIKMVEAMLEGSPGYFKQFQKAFNFSVCDEKSELNSVRNYAVCVQFENPFCNLKTIHYHILLDTSDVTKSSDKSEFKKAIQCLVSTRLSRFCLPNQIL